MCLPCPALFLLFIFQDRFVMYVCTCLCVHACACIVWRLEVSIRCLPPSVFTLLFEVGCLPESEEHTPAKTGWAAGSRDPPLPLHYSDSRCMPPCPVFSRGCLESELNPSYLHSKHFIKWDVCPDPHRGFCLVPPSPMKQAYVVLASARLSMY